MPTGPDSFRPLSSDCNQTSELIAWSINCPVCKESQIACSTKQPDCCVPGKRGLQKSVDGVTHIWFRLKKKKRRIKKRRKGHLWRGLLCTLQSWKTQQIDRTDNITFRLLLMWQVKKALNPFMPAGTYICRQNMYRQRAKNSNFSSDGFMCKKL